LYVEELSLSKGIEGTAEIARASLPAFKRDCVGPLGFGGRTSHECARSDNVAANHIAEAIKKPIAT